jgi:hypothetical protein
MTTTARPPRSPWAEPTEAELLVPFAVTGSLSGAEAEEVARGARCDEGIAASLAAARAEQEAVAAVAEMLGQPSARPLLDLFAAIDAEDPGPGGCFPPSG